MCPGWNCDSPQAVTPLPVPEQLRVAAPHMSTSFPQQQRHRPRQAAGFPLLFSPREPSPPSPSFIASSNFRRENMQILLITDERRAVPPPGSSLRIPAVQAVIGHCEVRFLQLRIRAIIQGQFSLQPFAVCQVGSPRCKITLPVLRITASSWAPGNIEETHSRCALTLSLRHLQPLNSARTERWLCFLQGKGEEKPRCRLAASCCRGAR